MRKTIIIDIESDSSSEINSMVNAIGGTINNMEYMAIEDISVKVYREDKKIAELLGGRLK